MTPRLRHLPALNAAFEFPNEALSFSVLSLCVSVYEFVCVFSPSILITTLLFLCVNTTYILMLGTQRRLWLTRLRWQRRDALRLASTQLGPMLCCNLGGNAGKVKRWVRGGGRRKLGINCVESTVMTQYSVEYQRCVIFDIRLFSSLGFHCTVEDENRMLKVYKGK